MYSAASGWLMTSLNPDPFIVALVQAADTLPICLFAFPAGVMADIFDKRKFLIVVETLTTVISAIYAVIVGLGGASWLRGRSKRASCRPSGSWARMLRPSVHGRPLLWRVWPNLAGSRARRLG